MNKPPVPIRCINPNCAGVLGTGTPSQFVPDGSAVAVVSRSVLKCPVCGRQRTWRPALDARPNGK